jgi:hypothetical protein
MSAAREIRKLTKIISSIGAMFDCSCCDGTLEFEPPEHILAELKGYLERRLAEQNNGETLH